ncbi:hypothetical protein EQH57_0949 [Dictyocoela roeselum]|nr:hypothetical protein EQH57_0949 [Dictyocoela roeselum]
MEKKFTFNTTRTTFVTPPSKRYETIAIDPKGSIQTSHYDTNMIKNELYILVVTYLFSRYTEIRFITNIHPTTVCSALDAILFKKHYIPQKCLSDNGRQFKSKNFRNLMDKYGIRHIFTSPYNQKRNSVVERMNMEITIALRLSRCMNLQIHVLTSGVD